MQTAVALFGIYEWFFLPASFWSDTVGAGTFMLDVKGLLENQNVVDGLPSNMFRFGIRRVISTYGDPLAMGIASVFPLLVCSAWLARHRTTISNKISSWKPWTATLVIAAALLLTIARESIGAALLGMVMALWWSEKSSRLIVPTIVILIVVSLLPQVWGYAARTVTFQEASASTHLNFIRKGWNQLPVLLPGKGLGEAGGWAFSLAGVESEVGESSYFELMAQTGLVSVLLLLGFLGSVAKTMLRYSRQLPDELLSAAFVASAAHVVCRSIMGVFSPSLFGVIPLASFFFFCGAAFTTMQRLQLNPHLVARRVVVLRWRDKPRFEVVPLPSSV